MLDHIVFRLSSVMELVWAGLGWLKRYGQGPGLGADREIFICWFS